MTPKQPTKPSPQVPPPRPSLAELARRARPLPVELRRLVAAFYTPEPVR